MASETPNPMVDKPQRKEYRGVPVMLPAYLWLFCDKCMKMRKVEDLMVGVEQGQGPLKGKRIVYGPCTFCGEECKASISTPEEIQAVANRAKRMDDKARKRRKQQEPEPKKSEANRTRKRKVMARTKTKKSKAEAEEKVSKKTKAAKAKTTSATKKSSSAKAKDKKTDKKGKAKTKAVSSGERQKIWGDRPEGGLNGKDSMVAAVSGGMFTVEEMEARHKSLVKAKIAPERTGGFGASNLTWLVNNAEEVFRSINSDGEDVFGAPSLKAHPSAGEKPKKLKMTEKKGVHYFGSLPLAKTRKEAKELIG